MLKGLLKLIWNKYYFLLLPGWWWWSFYTVLTTDEDFLRGFLSAMLIVLAIPMIFSTILLFWCPNDSEG